MKVAVQMDPLEMLELANDSTLCLIKEALARDFQVWHYTPNDLCLNQGNVEVFAKKFRGINNTIELQQTEEKLNLSDMDVVLMRQNPPVNMDYITSTYILEKLKGKTLVVNNPREVRNTPEKLFIFNYPEFITPTLVTNQLRVAKEFLLLHKDIVIKPLYAFGGKDIYRVNSSRSSFNEFEKIFNNVQVSHNTALMLQKFLPEISDGDKRVLIINGKILGVINRIPAEGEIRANMCIGGKPEKTILNRHCLGMCKIIASDLKKRAISIAGLDIIGNYITEINVTSPTGIQTINQLYDLEGKERIEYKFWETLLR